MSLRKKRYSGNKKIYLYVTLGSLLWGLCIFPVLADKLYDIRPTIETLSISTLFALALTLGPFYFEFPMPSEDKEYMVLFYPIITIPVVVLGIMIRRFLW